MKLFRLLVLFSCVAILSACSSPSSNSSSAAATPTPRPSPTFARIAPATFPLTDLPRKANFGGKSLLIDIEDSTSGFMAPDNTYVAAIPLNGGGSGGSFDVGVYGLRNHKPELIDFAETGDSTHHLEISNGRLLLRVAWWDPALNSPHCCADGYKTLTFSLSGGKLVESPLQSITRNSPTSSPSALAPLVRPEIPAETAPQPRYAPPAAANDCSSESIETVSDNGAFVAILGGGHYIIDGADRVDTALWLATDDVILCEEGGGTVKLIHDNEIAHAHHIR